MYISVLACGSADVTERAPEDDFNGTLVPQFDGPKGRRNPLRSVGVLPTLHPEPDTIQTVLAVVANSVLYLVYLLDRMRPQSLSRAFVLTQ